jgi:hypothetical protein
LKFDIDIHQPVTDKVQGWVLAAASLFYLSAMFFIARNKVGNAPILEDAAVLQAVIWCLGALWMMTIIGMREFLTRPIWVRRQTPAPRVQPRTAQARR